VVSPEVTQTRPLPASGTALEPEQRTAYRARLRCSAAVAAAAASCKSPSRLSGGGGGGGGSARREARGGCAVTATTCTSTARIGASRCQAPSPCACCKLQVSCQGRDLFTQVAGFNWSALAGRDGVFVRLQLENARHPPSHVPIASSTSPSLLLGRDVLAPGCAGQVQAYCFRSSTIAWPIASPISMYVSALPP
jgi:hypothetical protein